MPHTVDSLPLICSSPGTCRTLKVHRIGQPGARPKVYIQAALHANETPGLLIAHHLLALALNADKAGVLEGEIILVPYANPIGLSDNVLGNQVGREALDGGGNYNRGWPSLSEPVKRLVDGKLTADQVENVQTVRAALFQVLEALRPPTEIQALQIQLLKLAVDADLVIDLHTELVAVAGMVVGPWSLSAVAPLIAELDPALVHVTDTPLLFDSVCSRPWHDLGEAYGEATPVPQACASATLEMRGVADVSDDLALQDARAIWRHLTRIGVVGGEAGAAPTWSKAYSPHEAIAMLRTPVGGVVLYPAPIGSVVEAGAVVAEIVDPAADDPALARTQIRTDRAALVYAGVLNRLVRPNDIVVKIAALDAAPVEIR